MNCPKRTSEFPPSGGFAPAGETAAAIPLQRITRASHLDLHRALRCVSSGYLGDGCPCEETIPLGVVTAAWTRQIGRSSIPRSGFFRFVWQDGEWMGFGLEDGHVRGVYCPAHAAERDERSVSQPLSGSCEAARLARSA